MISHANLARVVVDTLRDAIGADPTAEQIRKVMDLLQGVHGELAAHAGRAEESTTVCAARRATWLALPKDVKDALAKRDAEEDRSGVGAMRIPCSCGAKEHEPCR